MLAGCSFFALIIISGEETKIEIWNWLVIATSYVVYIFAVKRILLYGSKALCIWILHVREKTKKYTGSREIVAVFLFIVEIVIFIVMMKIEVCSLNIKCVCILELVGCGFESVPIGLEINAKYRYNKRIFNLESE